jgi:hypothetical protein
VWVELRRGMWLATTDDFPGEEEEREEEAQEGCACVAGADTRTYATTECSICLDPMLPVPIQPLPRARARARSLSLSRG